jgi:1,2-phenylacetyl-CoA epoxidase catalytic subunit
MAIAQTAEDAFTPEKLALFAKIVLEIEPHRLEAQDRSAEAESGSREEIRRDFIRKATEIITTVGLTVPDYNRITLAIRSEDGQALRDQIEAEIRTLQASGYEPGQL